MLQIEREAMEKFEKKKKWRISINEEAEEVEAIVSDKDIVVCYFEDGVCVLPEEIDKFFDTENEAREWKNKYIQELREKMKLCREFILQMEQVRPTREFDFRRSDYLGNHSNEGTDYIMDEIRTYKKVVNNLSYALTRHAINIQGQTIPLSQITKINWQDDGTVNLFTGKRYYLIGNEAEITALEYIFGENKSGREVNWTAEEEIEAY